MYSVPIRENDAGQRFDKYLKKLLPLAPDSFLYKMLRKKNITLNGKKAAGEDKLGPGDEVQLFFSEETLRKFSGGRLPLAGEGAKEPGKEKREEAGGAGRGKPSPLADWVLYEDGDALIVNKPAGILSQPDASHQKALGDYVTEYLLSSGALTREDLLTFHPGVCNRLDRNTSGLVCAGKSLRGLQALSEIIRSRQVKKEYLLLAEGHLTREETLRAHLHKEEKCNKVWLLPGPGEGTVEIETRIRPVGSGEGATLVAAQLVTGKSHQIRAQLAGIGHPLIGDRKYGGHGRAGASRQMLHAWRLTFPEGISSLPALAGRTVCAPPPEDFRTVMKAMSIRGDIENL